MARYTKTEVVVCSICGISFEKSLYEINRVNKRAGNQYCSKVCMDEFRRQSAKRIRSVEERAALVQSHARLVDEVSLESRMNVYMKICTKRQKDCNREVNVTVEYLKEVWLSQNGVCPYSGIQLKLRTYYPESRDAIHTASLDRIDSSLGYMIGNVQFVSMSINYMKNTMTHDETIEMCKLIAHHYCT